MQLVAISVGAKLCSSLASYVAICLVGVNLVYSAPGRVEMATPPADVSRYTQVSFYIAVIVSEGEQTRAVTENPCN